MSDHSVSLHDDPVSSFTSFNGGDAIEEDTPGVFSKLLQRVKLSVGASAIASAFATPTLTAANADLDPASVESDPPYSHNSLSAAFDADANPLLSGNAPVASLAWRQPLQDTQTVDAAPPQNTTDRPESAVRIIRMPPTPPLPAATSLLPEVTRIGNESGNVKPPSIHPLRKNNSISKVIRRLRGGEPVRKDYWMQDDNCKECYACSAVFTTFRRKHHCRICGQIFCSKCASQIIPGDRFGYKGTMRVCNYCFKLTQQYDAEDPTEFDNPDLLGSSASIYGVEYADKRGQWSPGDRNDYESNREINNLTATSVSSLGLGVSIPPETPSLDTIRRMFSNAGSTFFLQRTRSNTVDESAENPSSPAPFRKQLMPDSKAAALNTLEAPPDSYASEDDDYSHYSTLTSAPANLLQFLSGTGQPVNGTLSTDSSENNIEAIGASQTLGEHENLGGEGDEAWNYSGKAGASKGLQSRGRPERAEQLRNLFNKNLSGGGRERANSRRRSYHSGRGRKAVRQLSGHSGNHDIPASGTPAKPDMLEIASSFGGSISAEVLPSLLSPVNASFSPSPIIFPRHKRGQSGPDKVELNAVSLQHLRRLLQQVMAESAIDPSVGWEDVLIRLMLKVSDNLSPDVRDGDNRDIRHYVKVKKIPGGIPQDSTYVRGVVCSKNVAHKSMARSISNPRILILTFPLEYQRVENQFLSLEPVLAQEREHLQNLVDRLVVLRPTLVLVQRTVSRLALEFLLEAGVTVAYNVKPDVISHIARCTRADVITSIDKLALLPKLGLCSSFNVRTFVHDLIPGRRKSYLFFDDCPKELGCSLVLRGGDHATLAKIKQIVGLLVFVAYNLKLETFLVRDQFACAPIVSMLSSPIRDPTRDSQSKTWTDAVDAVENGDPFGEELAVAVSMESSVAIVDEKSNAEESRIVGLDANGSFDTAEQPKSAHRISNESENLKETASEKENTEERDRDVGKDTEKEKEKEISSTLPMIGSIAANLQREEIQAYIGNGLDLEGRVENTLRPYETTILSASPFVEFPPPYVLTRMRAVLKQQKGLDAPEDGSGNAKIKPVRAEDQLTALKAGESYILDNTDNLTPYAHQNIIVLFSSVRVDTNIACQSLETVTIEYYRNNDMTLGQYLEKTCFESYRICHVKPCEKTLREHYEVYTHGAGRVSMRMQELPSQMSGLEGTILMWSFCKECSRVTPIVPMSEETWKYSFGKYLELSFYSDRISLRPDICPHRLHRDHVRCFGLQGLVIRFEYEPVEFFEIAVPPMRLYIKPETNARLKRADRETIKGQVTKYFDSMILRIKTFNVEKEVSSAKQEACRTELSELNRRAIADKARLLQLITQMDMSTPPDDTLALHSVRRILQKLVDEWEAEFGDLARKFFQPDRDLRRLTAGQLRKLFVDRDYDPVPSFGGRHTHAAFFQDLPLENPLSDDEVFGTTLSEHRLPRAGTSPSNPNFISPWAMQASASTGPFPFDLETGSGGLDAALSRRLSLTMMRAASAATVETPTECIVTSSQTSESKVRPSVEGSEPSISLEKTIGEGGVMIFRNAEPSSSRRSTSSFLGGTTPPIVIADDATYFQRGHLPVVGPRNARASQIPVPSSLGPGFKSEKSRRGSMEESVEPKKSDSSSGILVSREKNGRRVASGIPTGLVANRISRFGTPTNFVSPPSSARSGEEGRSAALLALEGKRPRNRGAVLFAAEVDTGRRGGTRWPDGRPPAIFRRSRGNQRVLEVYSNVTDAVKDDESDEEGYGSTGDGDNGNEQSEENDDSSQSDGEEQEMDEEQEHQDFLSLIHPDPLDTGTEDVDPSGEEYIYFTYLGQEHDERHVSPIAADAPLDATGGAFVHAGSTSASPGPGTPVTVTAPSPSTLTSGAMSTVMSAGLQVAGLGIVGGDHSPSTEHGQIGAERVSIMKTLTTLWGGGASSNMLPLDYPIQPTEHIFSDSLVIVKEDEPGSIIAFTMSSKHYQQKLKSMQQGPQSIPPSPMSFGEESSPTADAASNLFETEEEKQRAKAWHGTDLEELGEIEETLLRSTGTHIKYQFTDGSAKLFCKIFFAEQFEALRRNCGCDSDVYIQSLARCVKWDATGGKSGSAFVKTRDDRLVIKQMSRPEMDAFLMFAPRYFEYMSQAFFHGLPTVLAKIYGFYRIGYRNQATGRSMRLDVIVMENLFYERKISRIFDLKGSMRNRHVQSTGKENEVLLDENLVEFMNESPLFIQEYYKKVLAASLNNDTLFLSKLNVMDYSLLVGIDDERKELVVGIVDFIRTFTWDKKIESWVKETGFMGGGGKEPTIVSPRQYKVRFRTAMERYFLMVPTPWTDMER